MVNAFGRLATLATAVVVGSSILYSAAYLHSPPMQGEMSVREQNPVESAYKAYLRDGKIKIMTRSIGC